METKHKVIIAVLAFALISIISVCYLMKPKKYEKKKQTIKSLKPEKETTPIVVNNNIDTTDLVEVVKTFVPQKSSRTIENITAEDCADRLYNAMLGYGTDYTALLQCFDYIDDADEFDAVMDQFEVKYQESFDCVLGREFFASKGIAKKINEMLEERNIDRIITID